MNEGGGLGPRPFIAPFLASEYLWHTLEVQKETLSSLVVSSPVPSFPILINHHIIRRMKTGLPDRDLRPRESHPSSRYFGQLPMPTRIRVRFWRSLPNVGSLVWDAWRKKEALNEGNGYFNPHFPFLLCQVQCDLPTRVVATISHQGPPNDPNLDPVHGQYQPVIFHPLGRTS